MNGCVAAERGPDRLGKSLRAVDDEQARRGGIEPAIDEIVDQRPHSRGVFRGVLDRAERMLVAVRIDADRRHQGHVLVHVNAVDLDHQQIEPERSDAIHSFSRAADSATKCREAADLDRPAPFGAGTPPSGKRIDRWNLRVETLISIWFIAHLPSQRHRRFDRKGSNPPAGLARLKCRQGAPGVVAHATPSIPSTAVPQNPNEDSSKAKTAANMAAAPSATAAPTATAPRQGTKIARVIELLQRDRGAKLEELIAATGWLPHTARAALTGLRHRGYDVCLERGETGRASVYRAVATLAASA